MSGLFVVQWIFLRMVYWKTISVSEYTIVGVYSLVVRALIYSGTAFQADLGLNRDPGSFANPTPPNSFLPIFTVLSSKSTKWPPTKKKHLFHKKFLLRKRCQNGNLPLINILCIAFWTVKQVLLISSNYWNYRNSKDNKISKHYFGNSWQKWMNSLLSTFVLKTVQVLFSF